MPIKKPADEREKILDLVNEAENEEVNIPLRTATKKRSNNFFKTLGIVIIVILIIFVALYGISKYTKVDILKFGKQVSGEWQAVFLSNGQVYFGHVSKQNKDEVLLKDIYYLQVNRQIQPEDANAQQPELSLVKLGNEIAGKVE